MRYLRFLLLLSLISLLAAITCQPLAPPPPELGKPSITGIELTYTKDALGEYIEAAKISWIPPEIDSLSVSYYSLVRKLPGDSIFDVFPMSQFIPADTLIFEDPLEAQVFPKGNVNSVYYKVYAVDDLGRQGQFSDVCSLRIASQPFDIVFGQDNCLEWESDLLGAVYSFARIWNDNSGNSITSEIVRVYSQTDDPASFKFCIPSQMLPMTSGKWNYALFVELNELRSVKIGYFNVP